MGASLLNFEDGSPVQVSPERGEVFDVVYRRYFPRLVRLIKRRTGDSALAEDVAQETLLRALNHFDDFDGRRPLWPWLKTVALNLSIDHARKTGREVACEVKETPSTAPEWSEESLLLHEAMANLPKRQRIAMSLRYIEGWELKDAASFLGLTRPAFDQLLFRARRRLRREYGRIAGEAWALIVFPVRMVRRLSLRVATTTRRDGGLMISFPQLGPGAAAQLVNTVAAIIVAMSSTGASPAAAEPTPVVAHRPNFVASHELGRSASRHGRDSAAAPSSRASNGAGAVSPPADHGSDPVRDFTDPTGHVKQPEDANITSFAYSPHFDRDRSMFAAGRVYCRAVPCPSVLFRSEDGGATWTRLFAARFEGFSVALPPSYGKTDNRIFAMAPSGLQVSFDDGESFVPAAPGGVPNAVGAVAVSPAFNSGDPTILIGAQSMLRYDDARKTVEPAPYTAMPGPLEPAFAPDYPTDDRVFAGGLRVDPVLGRPVGAVFVCRGSVCTSSSVSSYPAVPKVRVPSDFSSSEVVYAFTEDEVFASRDGGTTFTRVATPWKGQLGDLSVGSNASHLYAAVWRAGNRSGGGVYVSRDTGQTWRRVHSRLFHHGATAIVSSGRSVVAARGRAGLACSNDAGRTWSRRCR